MRKFYGENKFLKFAILFLSFLIAVVFVFGLTGRFFAEIEDKTYDIIIDYGEIDALAEQSGDGVEYWLKEFRDMGIEKVGLAEESIYSLMKDPKTPVNGNVFDLIGKEADWRDSYPAEFIDMMESSGLTRFDVIVETGNAEMTEFVVNAIKNRIDAEKLNIYTAPDSSSAFIHIKGDPNTTLYSSKYKQMNAKSGGFAERIDIIGSKIMYISLGFMPDKIKNVESVNDKIIPRTYSYNNWNGKKFADAVIAEYEKYGIKPEYLIVGGEAVFGNDDGIESARDYVLGNNIKIGLIENTTQRQNMLQRGLLEIVQESDYNAVRVFTVWNYIQNRYQYYGYPGAEEIENTLFRAITERNIRLIYFKPFMENKNLHTYITDPAEYEKTLSSLRNRLSEHGYHYDSATPIPPVAIPGIAKILMGIGTVLAALILLNLLFPKIPQKFSYALCGTGILAVGCAYAVMPNSYVLIASFMACVLFGCLAVSYYVLRCKRIAQNAVQDDSLVRILKYGIVTVLITVAISILGGIMTAGPVSSIQYMLEIDIFRGVKIGQLLPMLYYMLFFFIVFAAWFNAGNVNGNAFGRIKDIINIPIKLWMVIVIMTLAGIGYYYIQRTGHDSSIEVSTLEMLFRNKMEEILIARPRNKEFLFAFPSLMLMVYCAAKRYKFCTALFGLFAAVGATSVINTFEHIRTPIALAYIRTGYSTLFGIVLGVIAVAVLDLIIKSAVRLYKHAMSS